MIMKALILSKNSLNHPVLMKATCEEKFLGFYILVFLFSSFKSKFFSIFDFNKYVFT